MAKSPAGYNLNLQNVIVSKPKKGKGKINISKVTNQLINTVIQNNTNLNFICVSDIIVT